MPKKKIVTMVKDPNLLVTGSARVWDSNPSLASQVQMSSLGQIPKRSRPNTTNRDREVTEMDDQDGNPQWVGAGYKPPKEMPSVNSRFKEAVKEAERSTLIFNLDMGSFPTINPDKMATLATKALSAMAAKKEGTQGGIPSEKAVAAINDAMSVAKSVSFFGKATKTCKKN